MVWQAQTTPAVAVDYSRCMSSLLSAEERAVAAALVALGRLNPFLPERRIWEARALGEAFVPGPAVWSLGDGGENPNVQLAAEAALQVAEHMRRGLSRRSASVEERALYAGSVFLVLYHRYQPEIDAAHADADPEQPPPVLEAYASFLRDFHRYFGVCGPPEPEVDTPAHLFACFFQIMRAFETILGTIVGGSMPAARLRAAAWQSIFSFDAGRYRRFLFRSMPDVPTLITGPTGTGKELVARAIGLSGYIPFDEAQGRFAHHPTFLPLHLAALPSTLVEAELFGHSKGSFTGAIADREGWLARCPRGGTIFLDEIGELEPMLQVKILRVLEQRTFSPVGQVRVRPFLGKVVAATNRDLPAAIAAGTFRRDLYYRLCGDRIEVPDLRQRLDADPAELGRILRALIGRMVPELYVDEVCSDVAAAILDARGPDWPWPGNVRELAQCARNVLIQGTCGPPEPELQGAAEPFSELAGGSLSLQEVAQRYCRHVWRQQGTYKAAAQILGIDWRTVRGHVSGEPS